MNIFAAFFILLIFIMGSIFGWLVSILSQERRELKNNGQAGVWDGVKWHEHPNATWTPTNKKPLTTPSPKNRKKI